MTASDTDLLEQYGRHGSEAAFTTLVQRHVNLVYSAALRQVRAPQLAEEVAQSVFTDLSRNLTRLKPGTILTAWLYQVTRRTAIDVVRREARRQARERVAVEITAMNATAAEWTHIEPLLDEAMDALDDTDRAAVLLRYFENKSLREVGAALGTSDDAAQKRVSRAVERLREFFAQRSVKLGAGGLAVVISAHAVQAAPVGLAVAVSTAALAGSTLVTTATATATATTAIAMTTLQKAIIAVTVTVLAGAGIYEARQAAHLRRENQSLQHLQLQQGLLTGQVAAMQRERDLARKQVADLTKELANVEKSPSEVLRLRGQVGVLRDEKAAIGNKSALSKITADPETRKMMREQQKMGMAAIYADLAQGLKLTPERKEQFNDLMADQVMDSIDLITQVLHDKTGATEIDRLFSVQELALQDKVSALLGPDGLAQYLDATRNLISTFSAAEFKGKLTGDTDAKAEKQKQLQQVVQEESQAALAAAGLPADFQAVPILNFRNIASEELAARNIKLMDSIFERVASRAVSFLDEEEMKKFQEYRASGIKNSQTALLMNRKLMAPISP